ncbi:DNA replication/repair protein RecF [Egibacter rhizosphaerae]|uniref:DNA replication and repair protein RecF n=1 Tax=Egibacter rhizosphaerae TaxID=1670831 RepID=A0A411YFU0_9ACTN|nr:DNA replication/repair protein RecF [Egibacter rhizosphaerae]QBI19997.1 DNA replication/repair protein RecF [Egibacter rhizosphaerae]
MARLSWLHLSDFRNYEQAEASFEQGPSVLVGPNAQGKTNLLEAVHYLATGGSHRVSNDGPLVREGASAAVIRARVVGDDARERTVELELRPRGRNRVQVDGQGQPRVRDAVGVVRAVLFAPEDLSFVRGDPSDRRRFLDDLLAQRRPAYLAARQDFERSLRQRNALLKDSRRRGAGLDPSFDAWTDALARSASALLAARIAVVHALARPTAEAYRALVAPDDPADDAPVDAASEITLEYELSTGRRITGVPEAGVPDPSELADELAQGLAARVEEERERGTTLAGPHRDELRLAVGDLPAKGYASHGEAWSLALALRLASHEVLREIGDEPVVLLDDVFAELDALRRARLAARCHTFGQVLITAAVDEDVPVSGPRFRVRGGTVQAPDGAAAPSTVNREAG